MARVTNEDLGGLDDDIRKIVAVVVPAVTAEVVPAVVAAVERGLIEVRKDIVGMRERTIDDREHENRRLRQIEARIDGLERAIHDLGVPSRFQSMVREEMLEGFRRRMRRASAN